jgi:hypothetical protein
VAEAKARIDANPRLRMGRQALCILRILNNILRIRIRATNENRSYG